MLEVMRFVSGNVVLLNFRLALSNYRSYSTRHDEWSILLESEETAIQITSWCLGAHLIEARVKCRFEDVTLFLVVEGCVILDLLISQPYFRWLIVSPNVELLADLVSLSLHKFSLLVLVAIALVSNSDNYQLVNCVRLQILYYEKVLSNIFHQNLIIKVDGVA